MPGLAELLPAVSIMFVRRPELWLLQLRLAAAGVVWPQGRSAYSGLDFPSHSLPLCPSLLFFSLDSSHQQ